MKLREMRWKEVPIGQICQVIPGYAFKSKDWRDEGIPVIKIKNIQADRTVDTNGAACVPESIFTERLKKFVLEDGDILLAMTGATAGKVGKLRTDRPMLLNQRVAKIKPIDADPDFIWSLISSDEYQEKFFNLADGAAQPNMSGGQIERLTVNIPDLPTQKKIAGILSAYDDLIENNLRRIKILEEMAQSLYREWFVHFRFPGYEKIKFVDSPLGKIPEGWAVKKLGEVADVNAESIRKNNAPSSINYIDIKSVSTASIDAVRPMAFADAPSRARRIVRHGDVIWSTVRPNRRSFALVLDPTENLIASTGFAVLSAKTIPSSYLYYATTTEDFTGYLINHATGAAYPAVNAGIFEQAPVVVPPINLLEKFNASAETMLRLSNSLQRRNENLRKTRDLLLPKLLSN